MVAQHQRLIVCGMTTTNTLQNQHQNTAESCCQSTHDDIARAAFGLYEKHGSQDGHDVRNWLDAEAHVRAKQASGLNAQRKIDKMSVQSQR
jgi:hypothetical protein